MRQRREGKGTGVIQRARGEVHGALVQQTKRYDVLAEVAREQGHAVNFVAGLIAARPNEHRAANAKAAKVNHKPKAVQSKSRAKPAARRKRKSA